MLIYFGVFVKDFLSGTVARRTGRRATVIETHAGDRPPRYGKRRVCRAGAPAPAMPAGAAA